MRVIAGKWKSKILNSPKTDKTRPTLDRVKEALFSMLMPYLQDATILDLFSGTGNLGIEALSRGAKFVYFNDVNNDAVRVIYSNVQLTNYESCAKITKKDYEKCLKSLNEQNVKCDIIFLDPPYEAKVEEKCLSILANSNLMHEDTIIVLESDKEKVFKESIEGLCLVDKRTYGRVMLRLYKREENI